LFYSLSPLYYLSKVKVSVYNKWALRGVFMIGLLAAVCAIAKCTELPALGKTTDPTCKCNRLLALNRQTDTHHLHRRRHPPNHLGPRRAERRPRSSRHPASKIPVRKRPPQCLRSPLPIPQHHRLRHAHERHTPLADPRPRSAAMPRMSAASTTPDTTEGARTVAVRRLGTFTTVSLPISNGRRGVLTAVGLGKVSAVRLRRQCLIR
jgi:hypothetical protein